MQVIIFSKNEEPVSDYEIENTYQMFKNNEIVYMSNFLLLQRFRVGVHDGDIPNFKIRLEVDNGEIEEYENSNYFIKGILGLNDHYLDRILNLN